MKKTKVLTGKNRRRLIAGIKILRAELAGRYDSQGVDCCQHILNLLEEQDLG